MSDTTRKYVARAVVLVWLGVVLTLCALWFS